MQLSRLVVDTHWCFVQRERERESFGWYGVKILEMKLRSHPSAEAKLGDGLVGRLGDQAGAPPIRDWVRLAIPERADYCRHNVLRLWAATGSLGLWLGITCSERTRNREKRKLR